ncbi:MAG TPA: hypothetical protein VF070_22960 [Streptosporangiaceae bacterium]
MPGDRYTAREAREAFAALGLTYRQQVLLTAVHEAGHVVAGDSAGLTPLRAKVTDSEHGWTSTRTGLASAEPCDEEPDAVRDRLPALLVLSTASRAGTSLKKPEATIRALPSGAGQQGGARSLSACFEERSG